MSTLALPEQILNTVLDLTVPVLIVASAGLGHVTVVVLVLFWHFCEHFDDGREMLVNVEKVLYVGMYVTHSESGIKYLIEVCFGHESHTNHMKQS